jgi:Flp pilus assembly pilin Flp
MKQNSLLKLLRKIHEDENGAISLETVLIIGAIALPILIFLLKVGWPWVKELFNQGRDDITNNRDAATQ